MEQGRLFPVATYTVPAASSTVAEPQMLAPSHPVGTALKAAWTDPVAASTLTNLPCTSGQSSNDETPT